jgi:hypothetical protein
LELYRIIKDKVHHIDKKNKATGELQGSRGDGDTKEN